MEMLGVPLSDYRETLKRVPAHRNYSPELTFDPNEIAGERVRAYMERRFNTPCFRDNLTGLPVEAFQNFSLDHFQKLKFSSMTMLDQTVCDRDRTDVEYRLVEKITNSMWRWGMRRCGWNEIVDCHDGIRAFEFGDGFEVRLDHTTGWNERGYSEYSRTFLDGVLAFLIYHRGVHVMTIGFSFMTRHRLLIQQVQLKQSRGNRWLYRLPCGRLDYVIGLMARYFPRHTLLIGDGGDMAERYRIGYQRGYDAEVAILERSRADDRPADRIAEIERDVAKCKAALERSIPEIPRLAAFYAATTRQQGEVVKVNGLRHYVLA